MKKNNGLFVGARVIHGDLQNKGTIIEIDRKSLFSTKIDFDDKHLNEYQWAILSHVKLLSPFDSLGITNEQCEKIWDVWAGDWHHQEYGEFDQVWSTYSTLFEQADVDIKILKKFIKIFRDKGLAYYTPCIDTEGKPKGSGTFLRIGYEDKSWQEIRKIVDGE